MLFTQVADLEVPVILVLNMLDVAERRGIKYDIEKLKEKLKVPIICINARKKEGIEKIKATFKEPEASDRAVTWLTEILDLIVYNCVNRLGINRY